MRTRMLAGVIVAALAAAVGGGDLVAQGQGTGVVETVAVRPNFFMIVGAGGNIAVQVGADGVVLVDSGTERASDAVLAAVRRLTNRPIRYIINTSAGADHVGGNVQLARAGQALGGAGLGGPGITAGAGAPIIATENVLLRMSAPTGQQSPFPAAAWPTETFTRSRKTLYLNDEGIEVIARSTIVWTVENGQITRFGMFQERAEALDAAGLSE